MNGILPAPSVMPHACFSASISGDKAPCAVRGASRLSTDGAATTAQSFVDGAAVPTASWAKVCAVATLGAPGTNFLLVQAAGLDALVDDVCVRVVDDKAEYFDAGLLGL